MDIRQAVLCLLILLQLCKAGWIDWWSLPGLMWLHCSLRLPAACLKQVLPIICLLLYLQGTGKADRMHATTRPAAALRTTASCRTGMAPSPGWHVNSV